jgi:hypothetical protein
MIATSPATFSMSRSVSPLTSAMIRSGGSL